MGAHRTAKAGEQGCANLAPLAWGIRWRPFGASDSRKIPPRRLTGWPILCDNRFRISSTYDVEP